MQIDRKKKYYREVWFENRCYLYLLERSVWVNIQVTDDFIEGAIRKAIKEYSMEQRTERNRKALHNTKLLLKNYSKLKKSVEAGMTDITKYDKFNHYQTKADELYVESIKRSKMRSLIVVTHIDNALTVIKEDYEKKGLQEKYEAFESCILDEMNYDDAALIYSSSKASISRWINEITIEVSVLLFGIEGLELI